MITSLGKPLWHKIIFLTILGVSIWYGYTYLYPTATATTYATTPVERGTLVVSVTASGQVAATNSEPLTTGASGVVTKVHAQNGDTVAAGTPVMELELDAEGKAQAAAAYASYLSALNSSKTSEQSRQSADATMWKDRQAVLDAQNAVDYKNSHTINPATKVDYTELEKQSIDNALTQARKAFDADEAKFKQSGNSIAASQAQVAAAWLTYQKSLPVVTAPISGTLTGLSLQVGSVLGASSSQPASSSSTTSSSSSQKVGSIKTSGLSLVSVNLSEIDVPKVAIGNKATVTLNAFPDRTFTGKVMSIDTIGSITSGVTSYPIVISLDLSSPEVYANMTASASIITDTRSDVLLVPASSITGTSDTATIQILKNNIPQILSVQLGASSDTQTEIISGIDVGDAVVTGTVSTTTNTSTSGTTSIFSGGFGARGGGTVRR